MNEGDAFIALFLINLTWTCFIGALVIFSQLFGTVGKVLIGGTVAGFGAYCLRKSQKLRGFKS